MHIFEGLPRTLSLPFVGPACCRAAGSGCWSGGRGSVGDGKPCGSGATDGEGECDGWEGANGSFFAIPTNSCKTTSESLSPDSTYVTVLREEGARGEFLHPLRLRSQEEEGEKFHPTPQKMREELVPGGSWCLALCPWLQGFQPGDRLLFFV